MHLCLQRGVRVQELEELVRQVLVEEAQRAIEEASGEVSVSKISVTTGIPRSEVARLLSGEPRLKEKHDVLHRVDGLWSERPWLCPTDGSPRPPTFEGVSSEFAKLAAVNKEVRHYPILFALERIGAIEYLGDRIIPKVREYIPAEMSNTASRC